MSDPRGLLILKANGKEYKLWMGMSSLADLQAKHGRNFADKLQPDAGLPDLGVITDLFLFGLQRYHSEEADRYLVDDILSQNMDALGRLMAAAQPDPEKESGEGNGEARRG